MQQQKIKQVTIRSRDLENGTFIFPRTFYAKGCRIESMYIPFTFSSITSANDKLYVRQRTTVGSTVITVPAVVTLDHGNYNVTQMITALTSRLNAGIPGFNGVFSVSLSDTSSRLTILCDTRQFIIETGVNSVNSMLGFTDPSTTYANSQTGKSVINLSPTRLLSLKSNTLGNLLEDNIYSAQVNDNSILCTVYLTNPYGSYSEHRPHHTGFMTLGTAGQEIRLDSFDLYIVDENMVPVSFNGIDWFVTMTFI